jgi:hypothetical protein
MAAFVKLFVSFYLHGAELAPGFIEDDPEDDGGMVMQLIHPQPLR